MSTRAEPVPAIRRKGGMEVVRPRDRLLSSLSSGIAVADPVTLEILYENPRFTEWFPPVGEGGPLFGARLRGGDEQRARERIDRGRPYRFEVEVRVGPRSIHLAVELRHEELDEGPGVVIEAMSISKQKEAEYMLESYSRMSERQARALEQEKERAEKLLLNIMPRSVYEELRDFGTTTPQTFEAASVLMLDFVGFTKMAISREVGPLIAELNDVFTSFDRIVDHFGCERIKTIGDAYMAVAGIPQADPDHEIHIARVALRMRRFLERRNTSSANRWLCRIGIGHGPVIGSIVGIQKYVYDIFGPAVNISARLEQLSEPMQILVSSELRERIQDHFVLRSIGEVDIKGFGVQEVFSLEDEVRKGR